ncbi:uncharacterized protein LOC118436637 [Folsomia candida]|nr:uncharacterized protein LOC118436637 [Folsomia candida]
MKSKSKKKLHHKKKLHQDELDPTSTVDLNTEHSDTSRSPSEEPTSDPGKPSTKRHPVGKKHHKKGSKKKKKLGSLETSDQPQNDLETPNNLTLDDKPSTLALPPHNKGLKTSKLDLRRVSPEEVLINMEPSNTRLGVPGTKANAEGTGGTSAKTNATQGGETGKPTVSVTEDDTSPKVEDSDEDDDDSDDGSDVYEYLEVHHEAPFIPKKKQLILWTGIWTLLFAMFAIFFTIGWYLSYGWGPPPSARGIGAHKSPSTTKAPTTKGKHKHTGH